MPWPSWGWGPAFFLGDWGLNQPCSDIISQQTSDVVSGCPCPDSHHSCLPSDGISVPLPRSLTLCPQVRHGWALLPCLTCLSGPASWMGRLVFKHVKGSSGDTAGPRAAHYTEKRRQGLQALTRVILLCFNHARVNYIFYSCNGYGGFSDVG